MPSQTTHLRSLIAGYQRKETAKHRLKTLSDSIRSGSKHSITLLHQDSLDEAKKKLKAVEQIIKQARNLINNDPSLSDEGFYKDSLEEYVEAKMFQSFLTRTKLSFLSFASIGTEQAVGGIIDFTGELVRKTLQMADGKHIKEIQRFTQITQTITDEFSKVSFSGKLREKYDDLERNLSKLERIAYEVRMR